MVDCLTLCNTSCITFIWCLLLSVCFPGRFNTAVDSDAEDECRFGKLKKRQRRRKRRICSCVFDAAKSNFKQRSIDAFDERKKSAETAFNQVKTSRSDRRYCADRSLRCRETLKKSESCESRQRRAVVEVGNPCKTGRNRLRTQY